MRSSGGRENKNISLKFHISNAENHIPTNAARQTEGRVGRMPRPLSAQLTLGGRRRRRVYTTLISVL